MSKFKNMVSAYLRSHLLDDRIIHLATDNRAVRLYDDIVGFAIFHDFFLLTKRVELQG